MTMRLRRAYPSSNDNVQLVVPLNPLCPFPLALDTVNADWFLRLHKSRYSSAESKAVTVLVAYLLVIIHPFIILKLNLSELRS